MIKKEIEMKTIDKQKQLFLDSLNANPATVHWNLSPTELIERAVQTGEGVLVDSGALAIDTGEFTGRSPKDKFVVCDDITENTVWWGEINHKISPEKFDILHNDMLQYLDGDEIYVRDSYACADPKYRINVRLVSEYAYQNLFASNLFLRPTEKELLDFEHEWLILAIPSFKANPAKHGTRQYNFTIINFTKKLILIGGSAYTGEIKKSIFSVLNFTLPLQENVLSMHCSANIGKDGDTAVFFGLSGTGKTTLSAVPDRALIGDDEHAWYGDTVFNLEGGCYAKCVGLTAEREPQIYKAIKYGSLLENVRCFPGTKTVDYNNTEVTENTRVSYPIDFVDGIAKGSVGHNCRNIFFLTADAFGVLPPISKLTKGQAMFHFISGYTAKVAGTEAGVIEPQSTFSACFGKAFLPLHPTIYAHLLGEKIEENNVNIWLVNTGWTGGPYGIGSRMKLAYTRAMIAAALDGSLAKVDYVADAIFGLGIPLSCPNVPSEILNPRNTWADASQYDKKAHELAQKFVTNFNEFLDVASDEMKEAMPKVQEKKVMFA